MEDSRRGRPLTGYGTLLSVDPGFIAAGEGANAFVSGGDGDDAKEGKEEREGGADVPPAEDYTEVGCVPGEEHLQSRLESQKSRGLRRVKTDVHVTSISSHVHSHIVHAVIHVRMIHCEFGYDAVRLWVIELIGVDAVDGNSSLRRSVRFQWKRKIDDLEMDSKTIIYIYRHVREHTAVGRLAQRPREQLHQSQRGMNRWCDGAMVP